MAQQSPHIDDPFGRVAARGAGSGIAGHEDVARWGDGCHASRVEGKLGDVAVSEMRAAMVRLAKGKLV